MRKTVKELATSLMQKDSGLAVDPVTGEVKLHWEIGYSRRLDSHVRQNLIDGIKQLQAEMLYYHGERFGSDGVEISAHAISAPDHLPVQGRQLSNEEFEEMQSGLDFEDVKGNKYKGFARPIGQWNCRHVKFPIVIGVSEPVYTDEQLKEFAENSKQKYELTQKQRAMETKLRRLKTERIAASAAGDELEAKRIQRKINEQQTIYRRFSEKNNLLYDTKMASVEGYRRISTIDKPQKIDIINTRSESVGTTVEIDEFTPCLVDANNGQIVDTQYSIATKNDLKAKGWNFNWLDKDLENSDIYKLTIKGDNEIQGLIALNDFKKDNAIYVRLAESAPHNIGKNKRYDGVGGHLFAIAIKKSVERGYGGFVFMDAKNIDLVKHYQNALGATHIGGVHPYRMYIDEENAQRILKYYTLEEN